MKTKTPVRLFTLAVGVALSGVLALAAAPAAAQEAQERPVTAEETADLTCMAVFALFGAQPEVGEKAAVGIFYYLGRLEGRDPSVDWLERFHDFALTAVRQEVMAEAQRCGQALAARGEQMVRIGERMTATGS